MLPQVTFKQVSCEGEILTRNMKHRTDHTSDSDFIQCLSNVSRQDTVQDYAALASMRWYYRYQYLHSSLQTPFRHALSRPGTPALYLGPGISLWPSLEFAEHVPSSVVRAGPQAQKPAKPDRGQPGRAGPLVAA